MYWLILVADMNHNERDRLMRTSLIVSIILNLFLAAVVGGHFWRIHHEDTTAPTGLLAVLAQAEAGLSPKDAAALDSVLRRDAPHYIAAARRLRTAREALQQQVNADTFDPEKTRQALDSWRAAWNEFLDVFDDTLIEALAKISPEGRRHLSGQNRSHRFSP